MRRPAVLLAGILLAASVVGTVGGRAAAQAGGQDTGAPQAAPTGDTRLQITAQDDWVPARGEFEVTLDVDAPDDDSVVQARVYTPVEDPEVVRSGALTRALRRAGVVEVDAGRQSVTMQIAVVPEADGTPGDPLVLEPGVYPLRLQLLDGAGESVAEVVTHLVHLAPEEAGAERRALALVVPFHTPTDRGTDGRSTIGPEAVEALDRRAATLAAYPEVPVSVRPTPETVNALVERRDGPATETSARLRSLLAGSAESLSGGFVRLDENVWFAAGYADLLANELDLGRDTLRGAVLGPADALVALDSAPSAALVDWLTQRGLTRLLVPAGAIGAPPGAGPAPLAGRPGTTIAAPSPSAAATSPRATAARRASPWLAVDAIADPGGAAQVVELAAPPSSDAVYLRTVLSALSTGGPFRPTTLSTAFDQAGGRPEVALVEPPPASLGSLATNYQTGVNLLSSLIAMVGL